MYRAGPRAQPVSLYSSPPSVCQCFSGGFPMLSGRGDKWWGEGQQHLPGPREMVDLR